MRLSDAIFNQLLNTTPDTRHTDENRSVLIYNYRNYQLCVTSDDLSMFTPHIEEMVNVKTKDGLIVYQLSEEQIEQLVEPLANNYKNYLESEKESEEYNKDPYGFYGVNREFFF